MARTVLTVDAVSARKRTWIRCQPVDNATAPGRFSHAALDWSPLQLPVVLQVQWNCPRELLWRLRPTSGRRGFSSAWWLAHTTANGRDTPRILVMAS